MRAFPSALTPPPGPDEIIYPSLPATGGGPERRTTGRRSILVAVAPPPRLQLLTSIMLGAAAPVWARVKPCAVVGRAGLPSRRRRRLLWCAGPAVARGYGAVVSRLETRLGCLSDDKARQKQGPNSPNFLRNYLCVGGLPRVRWIDV